MYRSVGQKWAKLNHKEYHTVTKTLVISPTDEPRLRVKNAGFWDLVWCSVAVIVSDKPDGSIFRATYSLDDEGCRYLSNVFNYYTRLHGLISYSPTERV
jgi:hypothetical protein